VLQTTAAKQTCCGRSWAANPAQATALQLTHCAHALGARPRPLKLLLLLRWCTCHWLMQQAGQRLVPLAVRQLQTRSVRWRLRLEVGWRSACSAMGLTAHVSDTLLMMTAQTYR
jgi:hypothetical protein